MPQWHLGYKYASEKLVEKLWNEDHFFGNVLDSDNVHFGKVLISFGMSTTVLKLEGSIVIRVTKKPSFEL